MEKERTISDVFREEIEKKRMLREGDVFIPISYKLRESPFGSIIDIRCRMDGEIITVTTTSAVILKKILQLGELFGVNENEEFPENIVCTVKSVISDKRRKYLTII